MKLKTNNIDTLCEFISSKNSKIIGLDGSLKAGKSTLGKILSVKFNTNLISFDNYLPPILKGRYPEFLKLNQLKRDVNKTIEENCNVIIEGICFLEVINKIKINHEIRIYVRNKYENFWVNEDLDKEELSSVIKKIEDSYSEVNAVDIMFETPNTSIDSEEEAYGITIAKYHNIYRPIITADIIYEWDKET